MAAAEGQLSVAEDKYLTRVKNEVYNSVPFIRYVTFKLMV